jgi:ryanodine receptor 2
MKYPSTDVLLILCKFQAFLYSLWYFTFSVLGNFNNFFFAAHLLDVAVQVKTLRTILQSVTHNGKQVRISNLISQKI